MSESLLPKVHVNKKIRKKHACLSLHTYVGIPKRSVIDTVSRDEYLRSRRGYDLICLPLWKISWNLYQKPEQNFLPASNLANNVSKCEIFDLLDSYGFYTIRPLWVGNFGTRKKFKSFSSWLWFRTLLGENFEFARAEHALNKFFWDLDQK